MDLGSFCLFSRFPYALLPLLRHSPALARHFSIGSPNARMAVASAVSQLPLSTEHIIFVFKLVSISS
jgi:hypothetical protein